MQNVRDPTPRCGSGRSIPCSEALPTNSSFSRCFHAHIAGLTEPLLRGAYVRLLQSTACPPSSRPPGCVPSKRQQPLRAGHDVNRVGITNPFIAHAHRRPYVPVRCALLYTLPTASIARRVHSGRRRAIPEPRCIPLLAGASILRSIMRGHLSRRHTAVLRRSPAASERGRRFLLSGRAITVSGSPGTSFHCSPGDRLRSKWFASRVHGSLFLFEPRPPTETSFRVLSPSRQPGRWYGCLEEILLSTRACLHAGGSPVVLLGRAIAARAGERTPIEGRRNGGSRHVTSAREKNVYTKKEPVRLWALDWKIGADRFEEASVRFQGFPLVSLNLVARVRSSGNRNAPLLLSVQDMDLLQSTTSQGQAAPSTRFLARAAFFLSLMTLSERLRASIDRTALTIPWRPPTHADDLKRRYTCIHFFL